MVRSLGCRSSRWWLACAAVAVVVLAGLPAPAAAHPGSGGGGSDDTMELTDEPGNWFRSDATGSPVSVVGRGDRVDFVIGRFTQTRHTVTLISRPTDSRLAVDQDDGVRGSVSAEFDRPGVYVFTCKIHPYMQGVVGVTDNQGAVPDVTAEQLPFIGHLGADSLPSGDVLQVLTSVAATDADKEAKWDLFGPGDRITPAVPGVGEVWVNTQFERVPGQADDHGVPKPGTITVVDTAGFTVEREIDGRDPDAEDGWNNPHNLWANERLGTVYNGNWFGKTLNVINRASGDIVATEVVGEAPTHIVTNPNEDSPQFGLLTNPLSAENDLVTLKDAGDELDIVDESPTGAGRNHPHGHWLTADGLRIVVPNVFKGLGIGGSVSIMDARTGSVLREFRQTSSGLQSALTLPVAVGIRGNDRAYVSSIGSGQISVVDLVRNRLVANIPVTFTPDGRRGPQFSLFDTLQGPIQVPVSPDGRWAGAAVLSLTTVDRPPTGEADHVALIDTATNSVAAFVPTPAGTHGAHWGARLGGGYYLYVTSRNANALTVIDPTPTEMARPATPRSSGESYWPTAAPVRARPTARAAKGSSRCPTCTTAGSRTPSRWPARANCRPRSRPGSPR
jgi:hypothetical protein